ncbi:MAG: glycosyltransferase family 2 protein [Halanaerobiales bacterium]
MSNPFVSIITPVYNSERYISETIESVLGQTYINWELIIVDDNSKDKSVDKINNYIGDKNKIKLIELNKNMGSAIARNKGIKLASGKYIAFLDSDDLWHPKKLERQIAFMEENNYVFSFTKYQYITEEGSKVDKYVSVPRRITYRRALLYNPIGCLTAVYNTEILGKMYMPEIRKRQDFGLWLKILKKNKYGHGLNENLAYYRNRKDSISSNKIDLLKYQWKLYRDIEKLSIIESLFYLGCVGFSKLIGLK